MRSSSARRPHHHSHTPAVESLFYLSSHSSRAASSEAQLGRVRRPHFTYTNYYQPLICQLLPLAYALLIRAAPQQSNTLLLPPENRALYDPRSRVFVRVSMALLRVAFARSSVHSTRVRAHQFSIHNPMRYKVPHQWHAVPITHNRNDTQAGCSARRVCGDGGRGARVRARDAPARSSRCR